MKKRLFITLFVLFLAACSMNIEAERVTVSSDGNTLNVKNHTLDITDARNNSFNVTERQNPKELRTKVEKVSNKSEADFYLGTKNGAFRLRMEEGETKIIEVKNQAYNVTVVFIGRNDGERAMFEVNGEKTDGVGENEIDYYEGEEFIYVNDLFLR